MLFMYHVSTTKKVSLNRVLLILSLEVKVSVKKQLTKNLQSVI